MVCIELETTLEGGIAEDLTVTLVTNVVSGTYDWIHLYTTEASYYHSY